VNEREWQTAANRRTAAIAATLILLALVLAADVAWRVYDHVTPQKIDVWCYDDSHDRAIAQYHGRAPDVLGACDVRRR
jgi:hypothetical protein